MFMIPLSRIEGPLRDLNVRWVVVFTVDTGHLPEIMLPELLEMAACLGFVALAVLLQWRWYLYYGLLHFAAELSIFTAKHFNEYISWPVALMAVGALVMSAGAGLEVWLSRRQRQAAEAGEAS